MVKIIVALCVAMIAAASAVEAQYGPAGYDMYAAPHRYPAPPRKAATATASASASVGDYDQAPPPAYNQYAAEQAPPAPLYNQYAEQAPPAYAPQARRPRPASRYPLPYDGQEDVDAGYRPARRPAHVPHVHARHDPNDRMSSYLEKLAEVNELKREQKELKMEAKELKKEQKELKKEMKADKKGMAKDEKKELKGLEKVIKKDFKAELKREFPKKGLFGRR